MKGKRKEKESNQAALHRLTHNKNVEIRKNEENITQNI